ncbi:MAG: hypothetical protein JO202_09910 [Ktedonobacteraceae bacterium]|nr:hypothetical protein [Ktedonobacteraceae bacterium]
MLDQMHVPATTPFPCPASTTLDEQDSTPASVKLRAYLPLRVGKSHFEVSPTFHEGYLAARRAYAQMEEEDEWGAYLFLTGYEYAHLTRQYIPATLSGVDKREWQRGFIGGWTACSYGF